jgi:hypothetical protein
VIKSGKTRKRLAFEQYKTEFHSPRNQNGDSSALVKHNPRHLKVKGSSPATAGGTESDKEWQN